MSSTMSHPFASAADSAAQSIRHSINHSSNVGIFVSDHQTWFVSDGNNHPA
jgi:hypothetical protein